MSREMFLMMIRPFTFCGMTCVHFSFTVLEHTISTLSLSTLEDGMANTLLLNFDSKDKSSPWASHHPKMSKSLDLDFLVILIFRNFTNSDFTPCSSSLSSELLQMKNILDEALIVLAFSLGGPISSSLAGSLFRLWLHRVSNCGSNALLKKQIALLSRAS